MSERPATREVVELISEDNGGHLLKFYGATTLDRDQVVDKMIELASQGLSADALDAIEAHIATLSTEQRETLATGEETDSEALSTPEVSAFLIAAFEADVIGTGDA